MARDDRERDFEKALARNLRPGSPADAHAQPSTCPDAELLASYHERLLPPDQMISWKEHISGCSRCQEVLAHLEATDEIPGGVNPEEPLGHTVLAMKEPAFPTLGPVAAQTSAPAPPQTLAAAQWSERRRKLLRPANWRWLAPTGAIAAILLLWVAVHENNPEKFEVAKNQPAPVAAPVGPPPSALPLPRPSGSLEPKQQQTKPEQPRQEENMRSPSPALSEPSGAVAEGKPALQEDFKTALKQKAPVAPPARMERNRESEKLADKSLPRSAGSIGDLGALSSGRFDAKKEASELRKQGGVVRGTLAAAAPPVSGVAGAAPSSPAPAKSTQDEAAAFVAKEEVPGPVAESVTVESPALVNGVARSSTAAQVVRLANNQSPTMVTAPNDKVIWRLEAAGIVQRSTDAGSTWTLQKTGVVADLTTGSAPSEKICWIAGRAGTILRTTDGGAHWLKVRPPVADDFSTIFAVDAQQATVSAASNNKSYKTTDGGLTWTQVPNQ